MRILELKVCILHFFRPNPKKGVRDQVHTDSKICSFFPIFLLVKIGTEIFWTPFGDPQPQKWTPIWTQNPKKRSKIGPFLVLQA